MSKIDISCLNLHYGSFHALKNVSFNIHEREITAFIGPSGCGKSTLLKCLNRMNDLVEGCRIDGEVLLDGVDVYRDMWLCRRRSHWDELRGIRICRATLVMMALFALN